MGGNIVVGNVNHDRCTSYAVVIGVGAGQSVFDNTRVLALIDRVVHCCDSHGLRHVPVGCGESQRGGAKADLAVGVVQRHGHVVRGLGRQLNGVGVARGVTFAHTGIVASGGYHQPRVDVEEKLNNAIVVADKGIEVAVGIDVHKGGAGKSPHTAQTPRVGAGRSKSGTAGVAHIFKKQRIAVLTTHKSIKITIFIDIHQGGAGVRAHIAQAPRVGAGRSKSGTAGVARVFKKQRITWTVADKSIEVAIAVNVYQGRGGNKIHITQAKRCRTGGTGVLHKNGVFGDSHSYFLKIGAKKNN
nr:hypothetical protein [Macromonas bipunctata]